MPSIVIGEAVRSALDAGEAVVALESALITHGFSYPDNHNITRRMIETIHNAGAHAAVIGVYNGQPTVGLDSHQIAELAADTHTVKVSMRDLSLCSLRANHGGTTVAATAWLASKAGIRVFATGGIGGVHRGHPEDVSADLPVLASTPVIVVCAGVKSILDLPRTLEYLETSGVPVLGWGTADFPAFYSRSSGLPVDAYVHDENQVTAVYNSQREMGLLQGVLVTVPVPEQAAIPVEIVEPLIAQAIRDADEQGMTGKALTPFILARMVSLSESRTRYANESLLINNALVASCIARAMV